MVADPAGRTSASEPKATEARARRGAEFEAMIETRGAYRADSRVWVSVPLPLARHPPRGSGGHSNATAAHRGRRTHSTAESIDARHSASGAAAFGASSDRPSR